ncbi:acyl-CoA dehydrogenase family protein [Bacillus benzoevorans]|uniref:Alkylation response protein AidB-like acyl-CoA dehydrogenase n=1 Tax=Bacillus benzoevorans TaxID=1456 RepID=A0A7X0HVY0_9BACI|nr:acyl-CoA dehydrogenase family protein [Bacillus benzoevorans]MBB6446571.1 alkylation response protein AidB-like acyl-CoA dehydrogenase [Bacillus benzoevorans]
MGINFELTEEQMRWKQICKELAQDFALRAAEHDRERTSPVENYRKLYEAGLFGLTIPKKYGGLGSGFLGYTIAIEELAQGCAATAMSWNMHAAGTAAIMENPDIAEEMKQYVADLVTKEGKLLCQSVSEPTSSSLIGQSYTPSLIAKKVEGGYLLNGKKAFASMFEASDYVYLFAHPENDPNPQSSIGFLLSTKSEGIKVYDVWDTLGMRATRSNTVEYDHVFVPESQVLHKTDAFLESFIMKNAAWAFGTFASMYYGIGRGIANWVKETLTTRKPKGYAQSMGYHPSMRLRAGEIFSEMEAARLMVYYAAWTHDTKGAGPETYAACLRAKYIMMQAVSKTVRSASIACGAHGLVKGLPFERMVRDAFTAPIMPPNEDAVLDQIGVIDLGLDPTQLAPFLKEETTDDIAAVN